MTLKHLVAAGISAVALTLIAHFPAAAQQMESCPDLNDRVVLTAETQQRRDAIWAVAKRNGDRGWFCLDSRQRPRWISEKNPDVNALIAMFDRFKAAGLVKPIKIRRSSGR